MKKGCVILFILCFVAVCFISGCGRQVKGNLDCGPINYGNLRVQLIIPRLPRNPSTTTKAIHPSTHYLQLHIWTRTEGLTLLKEVDIFNEGTLREKESGLEWTGSFSLSGGAYRMLRMDLLDEAKNLLGQGVKYNLLVTNNSVTSLEMCCLPVKTTRLTLDQQESGGCEDVTYYSFWGIKGACYSLSFSVHSGAAELHIYAPTGKPLENETFTAEESGLYVLGVFSSGGSSYHLKVNESFLPEAESDHLLLNELSFEPPYAIEVYNPTNETVYLGDYSIRIDEDTAGNYREIRFDGGEELLLHPRQYVVLLPTALDSPYDLCLHHTCYYNTGVDLDFAGAVCLVKNEGLDDGEVIDFILFGPETDYKVPDGQWDSPPAAYESGASLSRKYDAIVLDTNHAADWEVSYGTIGLPNNSTGQADTWIGVY